MPDRILPGPVATGETAAAGAQNCPVTDSVNVHISKIYDACRDKDCIEDLRVYPTVGSQCVIDSAFSVRPESATLIHADVNVDEIGFNRGYYTIDVTYFYKITGETFPGGIPIKGLAVFDKRVILYGSEGSVKTFSSNGRVASHSPVAIVEAVDPIALNLRIGDLCACCDSERRCIPQHIVEAIGEELNLTDNGKQLFVTLGQFSIIRLERDTLLTLDAESFLPVRECVGSSDDDPCTLFSRVRFPMDEFFPPDTLPEEESYKELV